MLRNWDFSGARSGFSRDDAALAKFFVGQDRGRRKMKIGANGERLDVIDWQGIEIVPVTKDFSFEHPSVSGRSEAECETIRAHNSIHIISQGTAGRRRLPLSAAGACPSQQQGAGI